MKIVLRRFQWHPMALRWPHAAGTNMSVFGAKISKPNKFQRKKCVTVKRPLSSKEAIESKTTCLIYNEKKNQSLKIDVVQHFILSFHSFN